MWFNPIMKWLIASPLHALVSNNMLLISYTGKNSGRAYTIPVNYLRNGDKLYLTSFKDRVWWRNLRDGSPVSLLLKGKTITAIPEVIEDPTRFSTLMVTYFQLAPKMARYYQVKLDDQGVPSPENLGALTKTMIGVVLTPDGDNDKL